MSKQDTHATRLTPIEERLANAPGASGPTIDSLVRSLALAKKAEELTKERRIQWEERIATHLGGPEDGAKTTTLDDGTKVTVTRGFNFAADCDKIRTLFVKEAYDHAPPVRHKTKIELDVAAYKTYFKTFPSVYRKIAQFVTVTPKKTSVVLKAPKA